MFLNNLKGITQLQSISGNRVILIFLMLISLAMIFSLGIGHAAAAANNSVIYVNGSSGHDSNNGYTWSTAKLTINNAIGTVNDGGTVNIASGIYEGSGDTNITIDKNMTINGANESNTIINAQGNSWIFNIDQGLNVNIQNLTLYNATTFGGSGGALFNYQSNVTVINTTFSFNNATGAYGSDAGAIYNFKGILNVTGSTFTGNNAIYGSGGAIYNTGTLNLFNNTFTNNSAGSAGAIFNDANSNFNITQSIFTNNTAGNSGAIENYGIMNVKLSNFTNNTVTNDGGAICNEYYATLNIYNSTFTNNIANDIGGAIDNDQYCTMNVYNTTFINNTAGSGGAIFNYKSDLNVNKTTFNKNSATGTSDGYGGGSIYNDIESHLNVISSIFTNNTAENGDGGAIFNNEAGFISFSRIIDNSNYDVYTDISFNPNAYLVADYNWWGTNNPLTANRIYGSTVTSWMVLSIKSSPSTISQGVNSTVTADLLHDNGGVYYDPAAGVIPYIGSANFGTNKGSISNTNFSSGVATSTFNAGTATGVATVTSKVDQATVNTNITINSTLPTVTSVDPVNNSMNVPNNKVIKVTFSEPITPGSVYNSITVKNSSGALKMMNPSISGSILTLMPVYNYLTGYKYTVTIPANAVKDTTGSGLAADFTSNFTIATIIPSVNSTDPVNGAVNVANNKVIKVTFSEPVTAGSAYNSITVKNSAGALKQMTASISGSVLTLTPVYNYLTGYKYIIYIPVNAIKDTTGSGLAADFSSNFTIATIIPSVNGTDPVNGAVNVSNNKVIKITFNEPIKVGSVYSSITVKNSAGALKTMNVSISGSVLTLTPVYNYLTGYKYIIYIPVNAIKDTTGSGLAADFSSNFTIATIIPSVNGTDPVNGAVNVSNNKVIKITFNEPIKVGSVYSSITVKNSAGALKTMNVSINGSVLTLTPVYNYLTGYGYTIYIPANAVKDSLGSGLAAAFTNSFTIATTAPKVNGIDPVNGAVNVPNNKVIKITFSEPIAAGSAYNQIIVKNSAGASKLMTPSISGSVLTLTPVYNYLTGYQYTITIPANAVKDSLGNGLVADYTSSFTISTT